MGAELFVLVLGTVEARKNVGAVLAALPALPAAIRVVIAGPEGNDEARVEAARSERVVRVRAVDRATRDALLRVATVLSFPSRYEGFGPPPLEALAVGTPAVVRRGRPAGAGRRPRASRRGHRRPHPAGPGDHTARIGAMNWDRAVAEMVAAYRTGGDPTVR